jgi:hypothetical protein
MNWKNITLEQGFVKQDILLSGQKTTNYIPINQIDSFGALEPLYLKVMYFKSLFRDFLRKKGREACQVGFSVQVPARRTFSVRLFSCDKQKLFFAHSLNSAEMFGSQKSFFGIVLTLN